MSGSNNSGNGGSNGSADDLLSVSSDGLLTFSNKALPSRGDLNVLVTLVYPCDAKIANKIQDQKIRDKITQEVELAWTNVALYYKQVSYSTLNIKCTISNFYPLSGKVTDYITLDQDASNVDQNKNVQERLFCEAAQMVSEDDNVMGNYDLNHFDIMACVIYLDVDGGNQSIRGCGDMVLTNFSYDHGNVCVNIPLSSPIYLLVVDEHASWKLCAHELGHCLIVAPTLPDGGVETEPQQTEDIYADQDVAVVSAFEMDLMGNEKHGPLFSGYFMEQLGYYSEDDKSIQRIDWADEKYDKTYKVAAHGLKDNGDDELDPDVYHLLKIYVSEGLSYYVEVRQKGADLTQVFDGNVPNAPILHTYDKDVNAGGVVVTQVLTNTDMNSNQQMRFINLLDYECGYTDAPEYPAPAVLKKGAKAIDLARGLTIEVLEPCSHGRWCTRSGSSGIKV